LILLCLLFCIPGGIVKWVNSYRQQEEWNQGKEEPTSQTNHSIVPKIDQIVSRHNLVEELKQKPYFFGYSSTGRYGAFLMFDQDENSYQINIYDYMTNHPVYSSQIPVQDPTKSNELILAQEALDNGYKIIVPPIQKKWENDLLIRVGKINWNVRIEKQGLKSEFIFLKKGTNESWTFSLEHWPFWNPSVMEVYTHPTHPEILSFVEQAPILINLSMLTNNNSSKGKINEMDRWLYGDFEIVYDQNISNDFKGYLGVSKKGKEPIKLEEQKVEQWTYLDPSGKMRWYGNAEGVFQYDGKSIYQKGEGFQYIIHPIFYGNPKELHYVMVDVYDKNAKMIKTFLFHWNGNEKTMILE